MESVIWFDTVEVKPDADAAFESKLFKVAFKCIRHRVSKLSHLDRQKTCFNSMIILVPAILLYIRCRISYHQCSTWIVWCVVVQYQQEKKRNWLAPGSRSYRQRCGKTACWRSVGDSNHCAYRRFVLRGTVSVDECVRPGRKYIFCSACTGHHVYLYPGYCLRVVSSQTRRGHISRCGPT